jgi:hypothetical protein
MFELFYAILGVSLVIWALVQLHRVLRPFLPAYLKRVQPRGGDDD